MIRFWYFDLGNVLLLFDHRRACRQLAEVFSQAGADVDAETIWRLLFASGLEQRYEMGHLSTEELYERLCQGLAARPPVEQLLEAASDIFRPNEPVITLAERLYRQGCRTGVLSNTNDAHWQWVRRRFPRIPAAFHLHVLSFKAKALKPQETIFRMAIHQAEVPPEQIFFVDDTPGNVAAARSLGIDAVLYRSADTLAEELLRRGVPL